MTRYVVMFLQFWWDFLIGDTPELAAGVLVVIGAAMLLTRVHVNSVVVVPTAIIALLAASVYRGKRQSG